MSQSSVNKNQLRRSQFLETLWGKYPDAVDMKINGRVISFNRTQLNLFCGPKGIRSLATEGIKEWPKWASILLPGDIIGIQKNGHCVMLAPNLTAENEGDKNVENKIQFQKNWNQFMFHVARFFTERDFLSVNTPSLVNNPGPEPSIDVFKTEYKNGRLRQNKFLITSPELHLKKIVAQTLTPIYEIAKVFRNNEHSPKHQPEFFMLEWYRPFATLDDISQDVKDLILYLIKVLGLKIRKPVFEHTTFSQILKKNYKFDFMPDTSAEEVKQWLKNQKVYFSESLERDDLFTLLNLELVESKLNSQNIVFLGDYPPYAAALAKIDQHGWAQRFEVYWQDLELGNAFYELNDPQIQEQRFIEDNLKKKANGLEALPPDLDFLKSLRHGLPPTAGISIGLERLFMALFKEPQIQNLKWFALN